MPQKAGLSYWRDKATPIIAAIISAHPADTPERRRLIRDAYPFGPRQYHPYKIWCDEVARQTGKKADRNDRKKYTGPLLFGHRPEGY